MRCCTRYDRWRLALGDGDLAGGDLRGGEGDRFWRLAAGGGDRLGGDRFLEKTRCGEDGLCIA